jgi:peptidase E
MKRREFLRLSALGAVGLVRGGAPPQTAAQTTRKILIAGDGFGTGFIRYLASLTGVRRPKLLYPPTASADSQTGIIGWYKSCAPLEVYPLVQDSFIASASQKQSWEEVLLSVDGIVASGGNTLNQQAIWHAQGIDVILRKAWHKGIVLGGASAGSICWFEEGTTDSRPKELTVVKGLGFLKGSHCPHYDREKDLRPLYQKLIASGELKPGYACDNDAGIVLRKRLGQTHRRGACRRESVLCERSRRTSGGEATRRRDDRAVTTRASGRVTTSSGRLNSAV